MHNGENPFCSSLLIGIGNNIRVIGKNYIEIHPNAFATELIRIMAAKIGHRY